MLIELFTKRLYEETPCDLENGVTSKQLPITIVQESTNVMIIDKYDIVKEFLNNILNKENNYHILEIEYDKPKQSIVAISEPARFKFIFKYDKLYESNWNTIHGEVILDSDNNVISFSRDPSQSFVSNTNTNDFIIYDPDNLVIKKYV